MRHFQAVGDIDDTQGSSHGRDLNGRGMTAEKGQRKLTERQWRFLKLKLTPPGTSSSQAARLAGYAPSVCRKADILVSASPALRPLLLAGQERMREEWRNWLTRSRKARDEMKADSILL